MPVVPSATFPGSFGSAWELVPCQQLTDHQKRCDEIREDWNKKRAVKLKELKTKYGGKNDYEMFTNWLVKEHGFVKVEAEYYNI